MGNKYHINSKGMPAVCRAKKGNCPFGGESGEENHYNSIVEAQRAADKLNEESYGFLPGLKKAFSKFSSRKDAKRYKLDELSAEDASIVEQLERKGLTITDKDSLQELERLNKLSLNLDSQVKVGDISLNEMKEAREEINKDVVEVISKLKAKGSGFVEVDVKNISEESAIKQKLNSNPVDISVNPKVSLKQQLEKVYNHEIQNRIILNKLNSAIEHDYNARRLYKSGKIDEQKYAEEVEKIKHSVAKALVDYEKTNDYKKNKKTEQLTSKKPGMVIHSVKSETEDFVNMNKGSEEEFDKRVNEFVENERIELVGRNAYNKDYSRQISDQMNYHSLSKKSDELMSKLYAAHYHLDTEKRKGNISDEEYKSAYNNLKLSVGRIYVLNEFNWDVKRKLDGNS